MSDNFDPTLAPGVSDGFNPTVAPGSPQERAELEALARERGKPLSPEILDALMAVRSAGSKDEADAAAQQAASDLMAPLRARAEDLLAPRPLMTYRTRNRAIGAGMLSVGLGAYSLVAWISQHATPGWLAILVVPLAVGEVVAVVMLLRRMAGTPAERRRTNLLEWVTIGLPVLQLAAILLTLKYVAHLI